jgi:hypothetical protein
MRPPTRTSPSGSPPFHPPLESPWCLLMAPRVVIGWHDFGSVKGSFTFALANALMYSGRVIHGVIREANPYVAQARNLIVHRFLKSNADYLLMVDADEYFPPDSVLRTLSVQQMTNADVLFGNYALGDFSASLFGKAEGVEIPQHFSEELAPCQVYEVEAGATGWLFATREALERIREVYLPIDPWPWFNHDLASTEGCEDRHKQELIDPQGRIRMGEDISFSIRAKRVGLRVLGYTGLLIQHEKEMSIMCDFMSDFAREAGISLKSGVVNGSKENRGDSPNSSEGARGTDGFAGSAGTSGVAEEGA